ncbi:hypothetical protein WJX72_003594 [[Myrmecia] bisecta]|uniref:Uncharacterized protein n=1 Tax=[Myrmecia] bisecta TaxID=41462 RepID=A0AAW1PPV0_9CHLO
MLGEAVTEDNWAAIARHIGRFTVRKNGQQGTLASTKYWQLQNGLFGDAERRPQHIVTIPFKMMVITALEQLPGREGTVKQIRDSIASTPAYKSELDWTVRKGRRASPMWHDSCDKALRRHPELFEQSSSRVPKHGCLNMWKLQDTELVDKVKAKVIRRKATPYLGKKR